jgi:GDP-D-mannose 3',5'-epimerase
VEQIDVLVTGAGGFIGGHLVGELLAEGLSVRAVDQKPPGEWFQRFREAENVRANTQSAEVCQNVTRGARVVYHLAADMGGMGFIDSNKAMCMLSVLSSTNMLIAARDAAVERFFYSSSACVYAAGKQESSFAAPLREEDAYPSMPEDGYGWEKLFSERMCRHFLEDFGLQTRVARFHNVYGPNGSYRGGREKAPAAICRKVAEAVLSGDHSIEIWGDGDQSRSFMFIDDCVAGSRMICAGDHSTPVNLGSNELVTVNELVSIVEDIAGVRLERRYNLAAPQGVRGRNSDNTLIRARYGWEPSIPLRRGMDATYRWVFDQLSAGDYALNGQHHEPHRAVVEGAA